MSEYFGSTYAAADGIILSYTGSDVSLSVPQTLADMPIVRIGDGAFMESAKLRRVFLPDGIREIGSQAFRSCRELREVSISGSDTSFGERAFTACPKLGALSFSDFPVSASIYATLKTASQRVNGTQYLARTFPDDKRLRAALSSTGIPPATLVPDGLRRLFVHWDPDEPSNASELESANDLFAFGDADHASAADELAALVRGGASIGSDRETERKNDVFERTEKRPLPVKTAVFSFDDAKTRRESGGYRLSVRISIGCHYWLSAVQIRFHEKTYYICRRHDLAAEPDFLYTRREFAVFSGDTSLSRPLGDALVTNTNLVREIYAKYRLMSIL